MCEITYSALDVWVITYVGVIIRQLLCAYGYLFTGSVCYLCALICVLWQYRVILRADFIFPCADWQGWGGIFMRLALRKDGIGSVFNYFPRKKRHGVPLNGVRVWDSFG